MEISPFLHPNYGTTATNSCFVTDTTTSLVFQQDHLFASVSQPRYVSTGRQGPAGGGGCWFCKRGAEWSLCVDAMHLGDSSTRGGLGWGQILRGVWNVCLPHISPTRGLHLWKGPEVRGGHVCWEAGGQVVVTLQPCSPLHVPSPSNGAPLQEGASICLGTTGGPRPIRSCALHSAFQDFGGGGRPAWHASASRTPRLDLDLSLWEEICPRFPEPHREHTCPSALRGHFLTKPHVPHSHTGPGGTVP